MNSLIKNLFIASSFAFFALSAQAEQISKNDASIIANDFFSKINASKISTHSDKNLTLAHTVKSTSIPNKNCFYVFNKGVKEGFIIVAADDCVQTSVLGYSDMGEFDCDNVPANFQWWVEQYQREIDYAITNGLNSTRNIQTYSTSVSPLLGDISWDQGDPYNLLCPTLTNSKGKTERTATGCVATATAQLLRYYKYPEKGFGIKTYKWNTGGQTLTLDFTQSTYDWDNMTETYSNKSTTTQKNAVAKLMYDCGISCKTNYNLIEKGGSSATAYDQVIGLHDHFGYDRGMEYLTRNYYNLTSWHSKIINELNNNRPILYRGSGNAGGHAFIIDGYNKEGYFHFNWGWSGQSNGYFVITALNPGELGIGGGAGGYNYNQGMTIGIKPAQTSSSHSFEITSNGIEISGDNIFGYRIIATRIMNSNWCAATFDVAFKFESTSNGTIQYLKFIDSQTLDRLYYYDPFSYFANSLAEYLNDDTYKISIVAKPSTSSTWEPTPTLLGSAEYVYMTVSNGIATDLSYDQSTHPNLSIAGFELNDKLYANRIATLKAKVKNTGAEYLGDMALYFVNNNDSIIATSDVVITNIPKGETIDVIFEHTMISLSDGISISSETPCSVYLYANANNKNTSAIGKLGDVILHPVGIGSPSLAFTKKPTVNSSTEDNVSITLNFINKGVVFKDFITFHTWDENLAYEYHNGVKQYAMVERNENKEITFSFPFDGIVGHTYFVNVYSNNQLIVGNTPSIDYVFSFTLEEGKNGVENITAQYEMTITNCNNILNISTEQPINNILVYNTNGNLIANENYSGESNEETISLESQPAGVYIIKVETTDGIKTAKVIIK